MILLCFDCSFTCAVPQHLSSSIPNQSQRMMFMYVYTINAHIIDTDPFNGQHNGLTTYIPRINLFKWEVYKDIRTLCK